MEAEVACVLDETREFTDELHVLIAEGADVAVPLTATGTGNTFVSEVRVGIGTDGSAYPALSPS